MRKKWALAALLVAIIAGGFWYPAGAMPPLVFPDGKSFAFSIVDDTDMATLERLKPLYEILERYGLRTTKTVWVTDSNYPSHPANQGTTLRDPAYRAFIVDLQRKGFEIALHGVRGGHSVRQDTIDGLDEFKTVLGQYPRMHVNHSTNRENLYWGRNMYSNRLLSWAGALAIRQEFYGDDPASPYFWGDVAKERIQFVRRFTVSEINLRKVVPTMPYHLADKPYVNYWFPTSDGGRILEFDELLSTKNIERLEREGGISFVYAHLGAGSFNRNGGPEPDPRFEARIKELVSHNGWFAPASEILEFLMKQPSWTGAIGYRDRLKLDARGVAAQLGLN